MEFGNGPHQCETKPASRCSAAGFKTVTAAKDPGTLLFWNALTVVENGCNDFITFLFEAHLNVGAARSVTDGVLDEIGGKLKEQVRIATDRNIIRNRRYKPVPSVLGDGSER